MKIGELDDGEPIQIPGQAGQARFIFPAAKRERLVAGKPQLPGPLPLADQRLGAAAPCVRSRRSDAAGDSRGPLAHSRIKEQSGQTRPPEATQSSA